MMSGVVAATAVLAAGLAGISSAGAATSAGADEAGDVQVLNKELANPHNSKVDISKVTVNASAETLKVFIKIADAHNATPKYAQEFEVSVFSRASLQTSEVLGQIDFEALPLDSLNESACVITRKAAGKETDISAQGRCVRNAKTDVISFSLPMRFVPGANKKFVSTRVWSYAAAKKEGNSYFSNSATDNLDTTLNTAIG